MHLLKIDVVLEPFLINIVKIHIEDAYFEYVGEQFLIKIHEFRFKIVKLCESLNRKMFALSG
jgi:hypothetical protein